MRGIQTLHFGEAIFIALGSFFVVTCFACGSDTLELFPESSASYPVDAQALADAPAHGDAEGEGGVDCFADFDCPPDQPHCVGGQCVECTSGTAQFDCPHNARCLKNMCIECLVDMDCPTGQTCSGDHECF